MSECRKFEGTMKRLVGGDIGAEELATLLAHADSCSSCESLFELHHDLEDPHLALNEPEQEELLGVRRAVLREIRSGRAESAKAFTWLGWRRPALAAGLGVLLLAFGFLMGRGVVPGSGGRLSASDDLVPAMQQAAAESVRSRDLAGSPYSYANVHLRDVGRDEVALSFDVATHMELVRPKDDPLVSEVVVQAMLQDESLGARLKAISRADRSLDPRVQGALILAMRQDPSLPVRLKALSKLAAVPMDPETEAAMLEVVGSEESAQMRLLAIDYLTEQQVQPDRLERAIDEAPPVQRLAGIARASKYLKSESGRSNR